MEPVDGSEGVTSSEGTDLLGMLDTTTPPMPGSAFSPKLATGASNTAVTPSAVPTDNLLDLGDDTFSSEASSTAADAQRANIRSSQTSENLLGLDEDIAPSVASPPVDSTLAAPARPELPPPAVLAKTRLSVTPADDVLLPAEDASAQKGTNVFVFLTFL